ncbi:hypothetical protein [Mycoplasma elephantis]|uniref:hypothetical protein n=1 Tax=Mycoplasma elephantis TaxID=114882 RepID=UPI000487FB65|nr:hypothetical protein [Mycoplasma elephantis]
MFLKLPKENDNIEALWKNEKSCYRYWIFGTVALIVVLILLSFLQLIFSNFIFKDQTWKYIQSIIFTNKLDDKKKIAEGIFNLSCVFIPSIVFIGATISLFFYITSIIRSYKQKDFKYLSKNFRSFFVICSFMLLLSLIFFGFNEKNVIINLMKSPYFIPFTLLFVLLPISAFIMSEVNMIRQIFATVTIRNQMNEFVEKLKTGDLATIIQDELRKNNEINIKNDVSKEVEDKKELETKNINNEDRKKLESLPNKKLYAIAEKLNIFGYEELTHDELITKILENIKK